MAREKQSRLSRLSRQVVETRVQMLSLLGGVIAWQIVGMVTPGQLIPEPTVVVSNLVGLAEQGPLWPNIWASLVRVLLGYGLAFIIALPIGFVTAWYKTARKALEPWVQFFRTIPPIALIPLVIVYLGVGELAQVSVIFFAVFLTVIITVHQGVRQVDLSLLRAGAVLGCQRDRSVFRYIVLPASIPHIIVGARLGLAGAWTTLVAAELIASSHGLGYMVENASTFFDIPSVYGGIILIGIFGFSMDRLLLLLVRRVTRWQDLREQ